MSKVLAKAVRDRERGPRAPLRAVRGADPGALAERTAAIVAEARRRFRLHNAGRRFVEAQPFAALSDVSRADHPGRGARAGAVTPEVREALERMWPVLTPAQLLHDLSVRGPLTDWRPAGASTRPSGPRWPAPGSDDVDKVVWTHDDVPLLDEARRCSPRHRRRRANGADPDEIRTYGHIAVDEAQDLSPMQLRMLERRSLNGSMTVVGDIAQATGVWAHKDWTIRAPAAQAPTGATGRASPSATASPVPPWTAAKVLLVVRAASTSARRTRSAVPATSRG